MQMYLNKCYRWKNNSDDLLSHFTYSYPSKIIHNFSHWTLWYSSYYTGEKQESVRGKKIPYIYTIWLQSEENEKESFISWNHCPPLSLLPSLLFPSVLPSFFSPIILLYFRYSFSMDRMDKGGKYVLHLHGSVWRWCVFTPISPAR